MKKFVFGLVVALMFSAPAFSTSITGNLAIAGATTYTSTGIQFSSPSVTLIATGNFLPLLLKTEILANFSFASAPGLTLFQTTSPNIAMNINTLNVISNTSNFLNVLGTATFTEPGFTPTAYDYSLTATRPDGVSSYTLTAVPATPTAEISTLIMVATGLSLSGLFCRKRSLRKA